MVSIYLQSSHYVPDVVMSTSIIFDYTFRFIKAEIQAVSSDAFTTTIVKPTIRGRSHRNTVLFTFTQSELPIYEGNSAGHFFKSFIIGQFDAVAVPPIGPFQSSVNWMLDYATR